MSEASTGAGEDITTIPEPQCEELKTEEGIERIANAFRESRIVLTAFELDVFTAVAGGATTSLKVARRIGADGRATDRLMNALVALGLLVKEGGVFRNSEAAAGYLVRGAGNYLSHLEHAANLYQRWATLTDAVKAGATVVAARVTDDTREREAFIAAMHRRAVGTADRLVGLLDLRSVSRVLDVGGGSGVYAMAFCRAKKDLTALVLDLPEVTALTRRYVEAEGFGDRIDTIDGDYLDCEFGDGFDLVFFSAIVHGNSPEENQLLVDKAVGALAPGGRIVIQDFVMDETRTQPGRGALFALNMLVNTPAGDSFTEGEIAGWLEKAGCVDVTRTNSGPSTAMMIARKPVA